MPLTAGKKYGIHYLYPPFFTQQLGIFSRNAPTAQDTERFLEAIPARFKFAEINLNSANAYTGTRFAKKENLNHELSLSPAYEALCRGFSENALRNIKKAQKQGLELDTEASLQPIIRLFRANRGKEVRSLGNRHYAILKELAGTAKAKKAAQVWSVSQGKELLAGALFLEHFGRSIFLFSGMSEAGKKAGAMFFLLNAYFKAYSASPIVFDFEGSNTAALARFYRSFGSKECVYLQVRRNSLPAMLRWLKK
jgi:hypothetical protein